MTTDNTDDRIDLLELDLPGTGRTDMPRTSALAAQGHPEAVRLLANANARSSTCDCGSMRPQQFRSDADHTRVCPDCDRPRAARPVVPAARVASDTGSDLGLHDAGAVASTAAPARFGSVRTVQQQQTRTVVPSQQRVETTIVEPERAPALRRGDLVAGAAAEGHGVLLGFSGRGSMTRSELLAILTGAGFDAKYAPVATSAHRHAGRIIGALNSAGYVARADRSKSIARSQSAAVPTWQARWQVTRVARAAEVGAAGGAVVLVATLTDSGQLQLASSDRDLAEKVRAEYEAAVASEIYNASDVSDWLKSILVGQCRAAKLGGNWYVKRAHAAYAERLLTAFSRHWGENYLLPALPVASSDQLRAGIAAGFAKQIDAVLDECREKRAEAAAERKQLTDRTSRGLLAKLREKIEDCVGFARLLGPAHVEPLRQRVIAVAAEIEQTVDGMSQRFDLIFDELRREAERAGE